MKDPEISEENKKKEKEKITKEEIPIRVEKEVKKIEIAPKKLEASVSPKKITTAILPVTRHRVSCINFPISLSLLFKSLDCVVKLQLFFVVFEELIPYTVAV